MPSHRAMETRSRLDGIAVLPVELGLASPGEAREAA